MSQHNTNGFPFDSKFVGMSPEGFPSGDRDGSAEDLAAFGGVLLTDGVSPDGLAVTAGTGLMVNVGTGMAVMRGRIRNFSATQTFTLTTATVNQTWNIVIRLDTDTERRMWCFATLDAPSDTQFIKDFVIAKATVLANQALVFNIQDTRHDPVLCGHFRARNPGFTISDTAPASLPVGGIWLDTSGNEPDAGGGGGENTVVVSNAVVGDAEPVDRSNLWFDTRI